MKTLRFPTALAIVCAAAAMLPATAPAAGDPRSCMAIDGDAARLACYDKALGRVSPRPSATATAPAAAPAATPKASSAPGTAAAGGVEADPVAGFGLTEAAKRAKDPSKPAEPQSISARVVSVQLRKYGEFVVTLDNGQVWEQIEPMPSAVVRVGDPVTVKKAVFGSYTLVTARNVPTKVRRID